LIAEQNSGHSLLVIWSRWLNASSIDYAKLGARARSSLPVDMVITRFIGYVKLAPALHNIQLELAVTVWTLDVGLNYGCHSLSPALYYSFVLFSQRFRLRYIQISCIN
jgi:hypothetical protein